MVATPPPKTPPKDISSSKENLQAKIEKSRASTPSGTLQQSYGVQPTGITGVKGSYSATGGGSTIITVNKGVTKVTPASQVSNVNYRSRVPQGQTPFENQGTGGEALSSQAYQKSLFEKQGYKVYTEGPQLIAEKPGERRIITEGRESLTTTSKTAKFKGSLVRSMERARAIKAIQRQNELINLQAKGKGRPAEEASRIIGTKDMSPKAEALFLKRKTELLQQAGPEAELAHFPLYSVGTKRPVGRQEYGVRLKGDEDVGVVKHYWDRATTLYGSAKSKVLQAKETIKERAAGFFPVQPSAKITFIGGTPLLTTKKATFLDVEKLIIPKSIQKYAEKRAETLENLPDYSFIQTFTSPRIFAYETTKALSRPIAGFAKEFTKSPVKTAVYTYGAYKILGALPKTKAVKYAIGITYIGGKVISEPIKFTTPAGYLETGAEFALWSVATKGAEKLKGSKAVIKTSTYKQPVQETLKVSPTGKRGTIQTLKIEPTVEYTVQGKRVKPIDYAKILSSEGKIDFKTPDFIVGPKGEKTAISGLVRGRITPKPKIVIAQYETKYLFKAGEMPKETFNLVSKEMLQQTTAHELIHYKTPTALFLTPAEILPYRYKPTEMLAFGLEKTYAKKGFKISPERVYTYQTKSSFDITVQKTGDLKFEYPRQQLLQKAVGKNAPVVSVSKGKLIRGEELFDVRTVTVGRKTYGSIIGKETDVIFMKGKKGGIFTKTLAKETIEPKSFYQLQETIRSKVPASVRGVNLEKGLVISTKTIPYIPENLKFKYKNILSGVKPTNKHLDIGIKAGDDAAFYLRNVGRTRVYECVASSTEFKGTREVIKSFKGKAISNLAQTDIAGPKTKTTKYGENLIIEKFPTDIKYALQPTYKPSTKKYTSITIGDGVIPISESVKMPKLITGRQTKFVSESIYTFEKTPPKPFKRISSDLANMGKKAQKGLTTGVTILETKMPTPELYKPNQKIFITGEELLSITSKPSSRIIYPLSYTEKQIGVRQGDYLIGKEKSIFKIDSKTLVATRTNNIVKSAVKSNQIIKEDIFSKTKTPTIIRTPTISKAKTVTKTVLITKAQTKTITPTIFPVTPRGKNIIFKPVTPPPPIPSFSFPGTKFIPKKKKKLGIGFTRPYKYTASTRAAIFKITGPKPKTLTGVSLRPMLKTNRRKSK